MVEHYSVKEVAEKYDLTESAIKSYIYRGQLKAEKLNGKALIISEEALKEWESSRREKPWKKRAKK